MERGVARWIVDISKWNPSSQDFSRFLSLLPCDQHLSITRFVRMEDRKRALVSRLLQHALIHELLGIPYDEIVINRTFEGKPYLESDRVATSSFPNFNFNVSHHGDYVAIASEPLCLVGMDIVCCLIPTNEPIQEFIQNFSSYFSRYEWGNIVTAGTSEEILLEFFKYWCLKEAYVKAIGSGLSDGLDKVEFHHNNWTNIFVKINNRIITEWKFWIFELPNKHWACLARGPPKSATESYKRRLNMVKFDEEEYNKALHLPNVSFVVRTVKELIEAASVGHGTAHE